MPVDKVRTKAKTIDEYLAELSRERRVVLQRLRKTIHAVAPGADECMAYQVAVIRHNGRMLVAFGASPKHLAFYLLSKDILPAHRASLRGFDASGGTVRFQPEKPLPAALVKKLVKARMAEQAARYGKPRQQTARRGVRARRTARAQAG